MREAEGVTMSEQPEWFGGCLCGDIRYQVFGNPDWVGICHCRSCRKHTGGILNAAAGFHRSNVAFTGEPEEFGSSKGVRRLFCRHCGSALAYVNEQWSRDIHLFVGTFDEPDRVWPQFHIFAEEKLCWLSLSDDLPKYKTTPSAGKLIA